MESRALASHSLATGPVWLLSPEGGQLEPRCAINMDRRPDFKAEGDENVK